MKQYLKKLIKEEDGAEMIEIVIGLAIVAVIVGVFVKIILPVINGKIKQSADAIDSIDVNVDKN